MKKGLSIALIFCFVLGLCAATLAEPPAPIPTLDIPVVKTWDDEGHEAQRPEKVTVRLMRGERVVASKDLTAEGNWAGTFPGIAEYDADGMPIQYTVEEDPLTNYTPSYMQPQPASLTVGGLTLDVLETPGHSQGSVCLLVEGQRVIFSGDTLFRGNCGRCDFPGGDYRAMLRSLGRLGKLEGQYTVYPGHDEATDMDYERKYNPYMKQGMNA